MGCKLFSRGGPPPSLQNRGNWGQSEKLTLFIPGFISGVQAARFSWFFFNWSMVDLQCCVNFCSTAKCFNYTYTYICILFLYSSPDLIGSQNSSWLFWYYSQLLPCLLHNTVEAGVLNGVPFSSPFQNILELYKCYKSVIWLSSPKQKQTNIFSFLLVSQAMLSDRDISKEIHKWSWSIQGH